MTKTLQPEGVGSQGGSVGRLPAVIVLTLALLTRLIPFFSLVKHSSATWIYTRGLETGFVAHSLLTHRGFGSPFGGDTGPTALLSPGYTQFVAAVFRLFGDASVASAFVILLAQIAVGVLTVYLIMLLAARLSGQPAAVLAGCFFALWPPLLWVPTIFWDTSLTLCIMPALVLFAIKLRESPRLGLWLAFGVLCGVAVLINLALSLTIIAIFLWAAWNAEGGRRAVLLAAALALLIYAPWPIRNARIFHAFIPLRTTVGLELWMGNREGAMGFVDESIFPLYNRVELDRYLQLGEVAYMQEKSVAAMTAIRQHPSTFAMLSAKRLLRFWFGRGTRGGPALYALGATFTTLLGLLGLWTVIRRGQRSLALLYALPFLLFPLPYYITHAEFRYRLALDPALAALAACFVVSKAALTAKHKTHTKHQAAGAALHV